MEVWKEVYKGMIPKDAYKTWITNSEEGGLDIELRGSTYHVTIKFGNVSAIRILDEGIVQEGVYSDEEISKYKKDNFMISRFLPSSFNQIEPVKNIVFKPTPKFLIPTMQIPKQKDLR